MVRKEGAELGPARLGPRREVDDRQPSRHRARPARQLVHRLLRRQTLVVVPEPAEIAASLLIGEPPQIGFPVRVLGVRQGLFGLYYVMRLIVEDDVASDVVTGIVYRAW